MEVDSPWNADGFGLNKFKIWSIFAGKPKNAYNTSKNWYAPFPFILFYGDNLVEREGWRVKTIVMHNELALKSSCKRNDW